MERRLKSNRPKGRRRRWWLWPLAAITLAVGLAFVPPVRHAALRAMGRALSVKDPVETADVGVMTESGQAGELEISDLYREHVIPRVLVLAPAPDSVILELRRRGIPNDDRLMTTLVTLGVPRTAVTTVDAGEGGTLESAQALAAWAKTHPVRILLVIDPTHGRRYKRTLMRFWPDGVQPPRFTSPRKNPFRPEDWWKARRTRRDGIIEFARLVWDYVSHPLG